LLILNNKNFIFIKFLLKNNILLANNLKIQDFFQILPKIFYYFGEKDKNTRFFQVSPKSFYCLGE